MSFYCFDTSAFVKHYHVEAGTDRVEAIFQEVGADLALSRLTIIELISAFGAKVRAGTITADVFHAIERGLRREIDLGVLNVIAVTPDDFDEAERLVEKHAMNRALRGADALQLAVAAKINGDDTHFVCSDLDLGEVARLEGISVINPEQQ